MKITILGIALCLSFLKAETAYVDKAMEALKEITSGQVDKIETIANTTESKNKNNKKGFVLSTQIKTFSDIPQNTDKEIERMKEEVQLLIRQVALDIQMSKENKSGALSLDDKGNLHYVPNPNLDDDINQMRQTIREGTMKNLVSIRSASLALQLLVDVNNEIIIQAKNARGRKEKQALYMKQAIYVYEISDIVLDLLNKLTLDGKNSIHALYKEAENRTNENLKNVAKQKKEAESLKNIGELTSVEFEQEINALTHIEKANKESMNIWQGILENVGSHEEYLEKLKSKKGIIAYKQGRAKLQIETLRDLRGAAEIKGSIGAIDNLVGAVEQLDLLVLDDNAVRVLLGESEYE